MFYRLIFVLLLSMFWGPGCSGQTKNSDLREEFKVTVNCQLPEGQNYHSKFFVAVDTDGKGTNLQMQINGLLLMASRNWEQNKTKQKKTSSHRH